MKSVLDCHCHTIASGHAYSTVTEYAQAAAEKELELIAITDHAPRTPGMAFGETYFLNLKAIPNQLYGVEILTGIELNILNSAGEVDLSLELLKELDVVIASLHDVCITPSTKKDNTRAVINAIKNPYIKIIGHLGDPAFEIDIEPIVKAAKDYNVALEINEASFQGYRSGGGAVIIEMAQQCKKYAVPVIWGTDSHFHTNVGKFNFAKRASLEAGLEHSNILNMSVKKFKAFIAQ